MSPVLHECGRVLFAFIRPSERREGVRAAGGGGDGVICVRDSVWQVDLAWFGYQAGGLAVREVPCTHRWKDPSELRREASAGLRWLALAG